MAEKYSGIEKYIFADVYNFFLKYKDMQSSDASWEICMQDAKLLVFKYKEHPLARSMVSATIVQLEHVVGKKPVLALTREQWEDKLESSHKMGW